MADQPTEARLALYRKLSTEHLQTLLRSDNERITLNKFYVLPNFFLESFQIFVFIFHLTFIKYANYQIFLYILSSIFFKYT